MVCCNFPFLHSLVNQNFCFQSFNQILDFQIIISAQFLSKDSQKAKGIMEIYQGPDNPLQTKHQQIELQQQQQQLHQSQENPHIHPQQKSQSQDDDKYYNDNDTGWNFSPKKPFDLKAQWLGNTQDVLKKFQQKLTQVQIQKGSLKKGLQLFQENQANYRRNSLRKIHFEFDKKKIYQEFIEKSRKPIQKLYPGMLLNIGSYVQRNLFFFMAKMRRVSKIFNFIYKNEQVTTFLSEKDLGQKQSLKSMQKVCHSWLMFERTFIYYKEIKYTDQIPPNSFKNDLQDAVNFINDIHKRVFKTSNFELGYFKWVNAFMKTHRVVIALSTLSLTNLIMIRKPSIVAFSNYLAMNGLERKKQEITKTRYSQVIKIVQDEDYRDCLIINTKVSNYLEDQHGYDFSVFIIHSLTGKAECKGSFLDELFTYNILIFHKYNDQKSIFLRDIPLTNGNTLESDKGICIRFDQNNLETCKFSLLTKNEFKQTQLKGSFMDCLIRDHENFIKFSQSFVYNQEYHYIIVIRNLMQYEPYTIIVNQNDE